MDKETIAQKRYRMLKTLEAKAYPDDIGGTGLLDQLIELAITEEREACVKCAEEFWEDPSSLGPGTYILARRSEL